MLNWQGSGGISVDASVRIEAEDRAGVERLVPYCDHPPFALVRLHARLANILDFNGEGRGSQALAKALVETERRVEALREEVDGLRRSRAKVFQAPPREWIEERL